MIYPQEDGDAGFFVYSKPGSGTFIHQGRIPEMILFNQAEYISPRISPDRDKFLYHSMLGGEMGIWITDIAGEDQQRLTGGQYGEWSPCGSMLVFQRQGRIFEIDIETGKESPISPADFPDAFYPSYTSSGGIIFAARIEDSAGTTIYSMDSVESEPQAICKVAGKLLSRPSASNDGTRVAYQQSSGIYICDIASRIKTLLSTAGGIQSWPVWTEDDTGICYLQSPEHQDGPHDIYYINLDNPLRTGLVARDVYPSFSWAGREPVVVRWSDLKGGNISASETEGLVEVENDWFSLVFSREQARVNLISKDSEDVVEIVLRDAGGREVEKFTGVNIIKENSGESLKVHLLYASQQSGDVEAVFIIGRASPCVEISGVKNISAVSILKEQDFAVITDRFSGDIVLFPGATAGELVSVPPSAGLLTGFFSEPLGGMLIMLTPFKEQRLELSVDPSNSSFLKTDIYPEGKSIRIALLYGEELWSKKDILSEDDALYMDWQQPFQACWRFSAQGVENYSRMWYGEELIELPGTVLPVDCDFGVKPNAGIVYLYARNTHTPPERLTPMDILYDVLGIDGVEIFVDTSGIRSYRVWEEWLPLDSYLPVFSDVEGRACLQTLNWHGIGSSEGGIEAAVNINNDVMNILRGLDSRIEEYREFLRGLKDKHFISNEIVEEKELMISEMPRKYIEEVDILHNLKEEDIYTAASRNRILTKDFTVLTREALEQRQSKLLEYRDFVKSVRRLAILKLLEEPGNPVPEEVSESARVILRDRYYFEGGWQGEKPLNLRRKR